MTISPYLSFPCLLAALALSSCSTPMREEANALISLLPNGAVFLMEAPGAVIDSIPRLRHEGYCVLLEAGSGPWPEERMATVTRETTRGLLSLQSGEEIPWTATIIRPREAGSGDVLWYFHGICGNGDFSMGDRDSGTGQIFDAFTGGKPVIVGVSLGDDWLLNDEIRSEVWGIMAGLQKTIQLPAGENWLFGFSMGGFNALRLFADPNPPITMDRCVLVAPCLTLCDPHATSREIRDCARNGPGNPVLKRRAADLIAQFFPESSHWAAANPLRHSGAFPNRPLLVLAGDEDEFGFEPTSRALAAKSGAEFVGFAGGHIIPADAAAVAAMAAFLER